MAIINFNSASMLTRSNQFNSSFSSVSSKPLEMVSKSEKTEHKPSAFESLLMKGINGVNDSQLEVNAMEKKLITDPDSVDIHDVTIAMAKAQQSLSLAQTVIDRLVSGWNELSTTR